MVTLLLSDLTLGVKESTSSGLAADDARCASEQTGQVAEQRRSQPGGGTAVADPTRCSTSPPPPSPELDTTMTALSSVSQLHEAEGTATACAAGTLSMAAAAVDGVSCCPDRRRLPGQ